MTALYQMTLAGLYGDSDRRDRQTCRADGEQRRDAGMALAASRWRGRIDAGRLAMLDALLRSPDGTATIDDATDDIDRPYDDGGKWRGSVTRSLATAGIIERLDATRSDRPSRHRGYITRWRLIDRAAAIALADQLRAALASH